MPGVTVKDVVLFWLTLWGAEGLIVPPELPEAVTVKLLTAKLPLIVWLAVTFEKE